MDNHDTLLLIMIKLDIPDLLKFSRINKSIREFYLSKRFWSYKFKDIPFYTEQPTINLTVLEYFHSEKCLLLANEYIIKIIESEPYSYSLPINSIIDLHHLNLNEEDIIIAMANNSMNLSRITGNQMYINYYNDEYIIGVYNIIKKKTYSEMKYILYLAYYYGKWLDNIY